MVYGLSELEEVRCRMELKLREAMDVDLNELAEMNRQLIEDEGSRNPMNRDELEARLRNWLAADWKMVLICLSADVIGYAVYRFRPDPFGDRQDAYVRHYFIRREYRKRGLGLQGVRLLLAERLQEAGSVTLDVLESNPDGLAFWRKAGFLPYSTTLKRM